MLANRLDCFSVQRFIVRAEVLAPRGQDFLDASQALAGDFRLIDVIADLNLLFLTFREASTTSLSNLSHAECVLQRCDLLVDEVQLLQEQGLLRISLQRLDYYVLPILES